MKKSSIARNIALTGYFGLFPLILLWYTILAPSRHFGYTFPLIMLLVPLVFPLRGMLTGKLYTYAWTSFLSLYYFAHGVGETYSEPDERLYGSLEILFSIMWFVGAILYVRYSRQENNPTDQGYENH
jgi:uncharacterized membrane protein